MLLIIIINILGRGSDQGAHAHYGYIVTIATKQLDRGNSCLGEMYKLDIRVDAKEAAATERRRSLEQQRQARIFNARVR